MRTLEDIRNVEALVRKIFCHLILWWRILAFLCHKIVCCRELGRSCRLKALIHRLGVVLEAFLTLFQAVKVVFFRIEWYVLLVAEVLSPRHCYVSIHLVDADEGW